MRFSHRFLFVASLALCTAACEEEEYVICPGSGSVRGHVCNAASENFVPNATVTFTPKTIRGNCFAPVTVKAAESGYYVVEHIAASDYTVTYTTDGFNDTREIKVDENVKKSVEWPECVEPTGTVKGRLCDERTGLWVNGGEVSVSTKAGKLTTTTDGEGKFSFEAPRGERVIHVKNKDYEKDYNVTVAEGQEIIIGEEACEPVQHGDITGQICSYYDGESDNYMLAGSQVFVEMGNFYQSAETGAQGKFILRGIPVGESITVHAKHNRYSTSFTAKVNANVETPLDTPKCVDTSKIKIAVVTGYHDKFEENVLPALKFDIYQKYNHGDDRNLPPILNPSGNVTVIDGRNQDQHYITDTFLGNLAWMQDFDIIIFNSSAFQRLDGANSSVAANINLYLQGGGSIYASDYAYEILRISLRGYIDWVGSEDVPSGDKNGNSANQGGTGHGYDAQAIKAPLAAALGAAAGETTKAIKMNYNNSNWAVMESSQPAKTTVWIKGDAPLTNGNNLSNAALLVSFKPHENGGTVVHSSITIKSLDQSTPDMLEALKYIFFEL